MTFDEARALIEAKDQKYDSEARKLWLTGFLLFNKYRPGFDLSAAEHDILYVADFVEEMTEEEILMLDRMGFHLDEDSEGWAKFV